MYEFDSIKSSVVIAMIDGEEVEYNGMTATDIGKKFYEDMPNLYEYIGYGYIHKINNVIQSEHTYAHFYRRIDR